ncbi:nuclear transport factor 2 family protein [bacterium]|nr:nuclear transport factor 2 family protein [bacterium]
MKRWIVAAVVGALMVGAAGAYTCDCRSDWLGASLAPDQAAMLDVLEEYISLRVDGDHEKWIALWDENGIDMPSDAPMREGKLAVLSAVRGESVKELLEMKIVSQEICCEGRYGFIRGQFFYKDKATPEGATPKIGGKFITIFRKQGDGRWLIYRSIFNRDSPEV